MGYAGDSLVLLADKTFKRLDSLVEGDYILSSNEEIKQIIRIDEAYSTNLWSVKFKNFPSIYIDDKSKILATKVVRENDVYALTKKTFLNAELLEKSLVIGVPYVSFTTEVDDSLETGIAWLYGKILSKGYISFDRNFNVAVNDSKSNLEHYKKRLNCKTSQGINKKYRNIYLTFKNPNFLREFLVDKKEHKRFIHNKIMNSDVESLKEFLFSFIEESTIYDYSEKGFRFNTDSKYIAYQFIYILLKIFKRMGSVEEVREDDILDYLPNAREMQNNFINKKPSYKKKKYAVFFDYERRNYLIKDNFIWLQLQSVKKLKNKSMPMFQLEIEDGYPFICNNVLVK